MSALQAVVTEDRPAFGATTARADSAPASARVSGPRLATDQPVVFPREGLPLDQRPLQLRTARAAARYQADGAPEGESHDAPGAPRRARR